MENDEFQQSLARVLDQSLVRTEAARTAEIKRMADERVRVLLQITSGRKKVRARARFAWFCLYFALVVIAVAAFMLIDGQRRDGIVVFMLAFIPLLGGGWHLHQANLEEIGWARELELLGSADTEH